MNSNQEAKLVAVEEFQCNIKLEELNRDVLEEPITLSECKEAQGVLPPNKRKVPMGISFTKSVDLKSFLQLCYVLLNKVNFP